MKIEEIMIKLDIPYRYGYVNMFNKGDKITPSNDNDWEKKVIENYNKRSNKLYMVKFLKYFYKDKCLVVIDFDNHKEDNGLSLDKVYETFPFLKGCYYTKSMGGKGYHFYCITDIKYATITTETKIKVGGLDIDYLTGFVFELENNEVYGNELKELSEGEVRLIYPDIDNKLNKSAKINIKNNISIDNMDTSINKKEVKELFKLIDDKKSDNYNDWYQVISA